MKPVVLEKLAEAVEAGTEWLLAKLEEAGAAYDKFVEAVKAAVETVEVEIPSGMGETELDNMINGIIW